MSHEPMDLEALKLFVTVVRRGSFAEAARETDLDPSSVSRVIAGLEVELGLRLFQRSTRRMSLTEAGGLYLARVEPLIEELECARTEARDVGASPTGTLRLTASVTFGQTVIVPLLPEFRARHPALKLDAIFTDANVGLVAERIDLAIRLAPSVEGDVIATRLMATRYRVVASASYMARAPALETPSDLGRHSCLLFPFRTFRSRWTFKDAEGGTQDVAIQGDVTLSTAVALRDAALLGLGPALLPHWLVDADIGSGRLVDLFPDHAVTATTFDTAAWLVYPSRSYLPNKVRVMIDFLKERLSR